MHVRESGATPRTVPFTVPYKHLQSAIRPLLATSGLDCEFEQPLGVAAVDSVPLVLSDVEPVDHFDCLTSVERSALRVERRIRSEENPIDAEEVQAAPRGRVRTEQSGVGVEHLEVIDWPLLHRSEQAFVIFI